MYDRVNKWGGAERVLLALHKIFPHAPLYTSVYHPQKAKWAKKFTVKTSFLQKVPLAQTYHQFFAPLMPFAFKSFRFDAYDVVLSVTSESAKAIKVVGDVKHICLCLTPTRYLWSGYEEYFPHTIVRNLTKPVVSALRFLDKKSAQNPHQIIAISKEVQKRIRTYYGRKSELLYPPISLSFSKRKKKPGKYFLVVSRLSRLTGYKRVDLAVKAATELSLPLIVIGQGNAKYLKKYAGPTVKFVGKVSDKKLQTYYQNAKALIFPGKEDFGLVMVEAQAAGVPVIAYKAGGAREIVKEGKTGVFFPKQTVVSLVNTLKSFKESTYNSKSCQENSKRFSFSYFEKSLKEYILKATD